MTISMRSLLGQTAVPDGGAGDRLRWPDWPRQPATAEQRAKDLFGAKKLPAAAAAQSFGFYSKGCFAGGVAIPMDGPTWEVMRPSRNRRWGHPAMIALIEKLSRDAAADGWPGLLIGDISQPRGGPMLTGHASHQIGLDADIWLTPMPRPQAYDRSERENISATLDGRRQDASGEGQRCGSRCIRGF